MKRYRKWVCAPLVALALAMSAPAFAEGEISTTVVMRVSHVTQRAVVNAGEDLSMEVNISGVEPSAYQWYHEGQAIPGANQKVYTLVNAQAEDGAMLVSMDISARVIDDTIPQSGDASLPVGAAFAGLALAGAGLCLSARRRVRG